MTAAKVLLKVASLNTWHGLNGRGTVFFGLLESRRERLERLGRQLNCLRALDADLILLQEVNPLPFRAHWYAEQLGKRCLFASCNVGVKLGWGPPGNLNEGLALLYPPDWKAEHLGKKRLSGNFRMAPFRISEVGGPFLSFQLHESRVAMAVRIHLPEHARRTSFGGAQSVLVAVTHLHHAPALTPRNQALIEEARNEGLTPQEEDHLVKSFRAANSRRISEVDTLASWLERLRKPGEMVIIGGDFNCEPDSAPLASLRRRGWIDSWQSAENPDDLSQSATWDPVQNPLSHRSQDFHQSGSKFSPLVAKVVQRTDALQRRIDYLFLYPWRPIDSPHKNDEIGCMGQLLDVKRFGFLTGNALSSENLVTDNFSELVRFKEPHKEGETCSIELSERFVSDHYGLIARFGIDPC